MLKVEMSHAAKIEEDYALEKQIQEEERLLIADEGVLWGWVWCLFLLSNCLSSSGDSGRETKRSVSLNSTPF